eukprot:scaffold3424_cov256-Pinguiococcus_pyrenoidosus.AAC.2
MEGMNIVPKYNVEILFARSDGARSAPSHFRLPKERALKDRRPVDEVADLPKPGPTGVEHLERINTRSMNTNHTPPHRSPARVGARRSCHFQIDARPSGSASAPVAPTASACFSDSHSASAVLKLRFKRSCVVVAFHDSASWASRVVERSGGTSSPDSTGSAGSEAVGPSERTGPFPGGAY